MKALNATYDLVGRLFTRTEAYAAGLTSQQLSNGPWKQVLHRVYADNNLPITHTELCRALLMSRGTTDLCFAGPTAAWLLGLRMPQPRDTLHVLVNRSQQFGPMKRVAVHTSLFPVDDCSHTLSSGWICTRPLKTAWDTACWLPAKESIGYVDAMCAAGWLTTHQLNQFARLQPAVKGAGRARFVLSHAITDSRSPAESRMRLMLADTDLPTPTVNYGVKIDATLVAIVDFAWPDHRVALEYDGLYHSGSAQMERDRRRLNALIAAGWTVVHATRVHAYGTEFPTLVEQLRRALSSTRR